MHKILASVATTALALGGLTVAAMPAAADVAPPSSPAAPELVVPADPGQITDCDATIEDVVVPEDTEAIDYTFDGRYLVARTMPGYTFGSGGSFGRYRHTPDEDPRQGGFLTGHTAELGIEQLVAPRCGLTVLSYEPVCVDGTPHLKYEIARPEGATRDDIALISWEGDRAGWEVLASGSGHDYPLSGLYHWPDIVVNADGTYSSRDNPQVRVADVDLHFSAGYLGADGIRRYYATFFEDAPITNPCGTDATVPAATPVANPVSSTSQSPSAAADSTEVLPETGATVGTAVGATALLLALGTGLLWYRRRLVARD
ncbi:LPXTG cell wall anchor domain-containing protein [Antribacter sp. KLBMP9083]|uniref:LPXTG cell wall anchor domain-containing protein n=1 Tax=Antribacter soli TaxID=2910976 RepID=A0AA41U6M4_9MICO|nr:LPXTG cell wall anchor domain-containing protein [Antribacter soli]MCF4120450.1 LPXTG cell wall anchor domain-containing protein [Antribacter soli]